MSLEDDMKTVAGDLDLLNELERQNFDEIRRLRAHERVELRIGVQLRGASSSQIDEIRIEGETKDVSTGGCMAIFTTPVGVGDVYRVTFDSSKLNVPMVFGRCLRCCLLREDAFEAAFSFFSPITLASAPQQAKRDLLD